MFLIIVCVADCVAVLLTTTACYRVDYANTERELCISSNLTTRQERVLLTVVFQVHIHIALSLSICKGLQHSIMYTTKCVVISETESQESTHLLLRSPLHVTSQIMVRSSPPLTPP